MCIYTYMCVCMLSRVRLSETPWIVVQLPGSSVPGIIQAKVLEWVAVFFSRGSSRPRARTGISCVSCIGRWILYHYVPWEAHMCTYRDGEGHGTLACCSLWGHEELDTAQQLHNEYAYVCGCICPCLHISISADDSFALIYA